MPAPKKIVTASAALIAAFAAGHVSGQFIAPLSAKSYVAAVRFAPDGKIGVDIDLAIGSATARHVVNCDADGSAPVINSQPSANENAKALCALAAKMRPEIGNAADALAGTLASK